MVKKRHIYNEDSKLSLKSSKEKISVLPMRLLHHMKILFTLILVIVFTRTSRFTFHVPIAHRILIPSISNMSVAALACSASTFQSPVVNGAEFLSIEANLVTNYSKYVHSGYYANHGSVNVTNTTFCRVSLEYTHPGQNDTVNVEVWMPTKWNGRMMGLGGGGTVAGLFTLSYMAMTGAVGEGYAAVSTDAGLPHEEDPKQWAEVSPGNTNLYLLQNLASVSLNDAAIIGKNMIADYYKQPPAYSYWNGCSQGGRQGLMLAQRYPQAYDGIAAAAPAINWSEFIIGDYFPTMIMDSTQEYPHPCEIDAITNEAIKACDMLDGVEDGVLADPSLCKFDPFLLVGTTINCTDSKSSLKISRGAAKAVEAAWSGAKATDNTSLWYGASKDSTLTATTSPAILGTVCSENGTCSRSEFSLADDWIRLFVLKNNSADLTTMTRAGYERIFHDSVQQFSSIIGTSDPDLRQFRDLGHKMVTYHGLADAIITPGGSMHYYDAATAIDTNIADYYRLFFAPGVGHCFGGPGAYPDTTFEALRRWVEEGIAPETLIATTPESNGTPILNRILCAYPKQQIYDGHGDTTKAASFYCV